MGIRFGGTDLLAGCRKGFMQDDQQASDQELRCAKISRRL